MARNAIKTKEKGPAVNMWLLVAFGALVVIGILVMISSNQKPSDPTYSAAPPLHATPGHPLIPSTKSPEDLQRMKEQNGLR